MDISIIGGYLQYFFYRDIIISVLDRLKVINRYQKITVGMNKTVKMLQYQR